MEAVRPPRGRNRNKMRFAPERSGPGFYMLLVLRDSVGVGRPAVARMEHPPILGVGNDRRSFHGRAQLAPTSYCAIQWVWGRPAVARMGYPPILGVGNDRRSFHGRAQLAPTGLYRCEAAPTKADYSKGVRSGTDCPCVIYCGRARPAQRAGRAYSCPGTHRLYQNREGWIWVNEF